MQVTDEQYAEALKTIRAYREERGMDFYLPINIDKAPEQISIDEFNRYLTLQKQQQ